MKELYISNETVLLDDEDYEKISKMRGWYVMHGKRNSRTLYATHDTYGRMHRYILGLDDPNILVDHIDRNGLNNQKSNLRITNCSINKRNSHPISNNKFNFNGLSYEKPNRNRKGRIKVSYSSNERVENRPNTFKQKTKSFSASTYNFNYNEMVRDAVLFRIEMMRKYNYIVDERSETIEKKCLEKDCNMEEILGISFKDIFEVE